MADRGHSGTAYRLCREWVLSAEYEAQHGPGCVRCGAFVDKQLSGRHPWGPTLDMVRPWSKGGQMVIANSALSHNRCNAGYRDGRKLRPVTTARVVRRGRYIPSGSC